MSVALYTAFQLKTKVHNDVQCQHSTALEDKVVGKERLKENVLFRHDRTWEDNTGNGYGSGNCNGALINEFTVN